jgi:hypothetical protein
MGRSDTFVVVVVVNRSEEREDLLLLPALHVFHQRFVHGLFLRPLLANFLRADQEFVVDRKICRHVWKSTQQGSLVNCFAPNVQS